MNKTQIYVEPEMEVTMFTASDVITTSSGEGVGGPGVALPDEEL